MTIQPEKAWAAFCTTGTPRPFIYADLVRDRQDPIRQYLGNAHAKPSDLDYMQGWRRAYRKGWRIIRVEVRVL